MARIVAAPIFDTTPKDHLQPGVSIATLPLTDGVSFPVPDVTSGMVVGLPRDTVPAGSFADAKNARVGGDWIGSRPGTSEVGEKPDSYRVIGLFGVIHENGTKSLCRVTRGSFHVWNGSSWIPFNIIGGFSGTAFKSSATPLFDRLYLSPGDAEGIWEVNFSNRTVTRIQDAPSAKFLYTFAERVCAANIRKGAGGHSPNAVAWSANSNPIDWLSESSGEEQLIADDLGNEITGVGVIEDTAIIIRRHSIVHQTRQPFAIAPFRFDTVITGIGSDLPYTTVVTPYGVIFADSRTSDVYVYRPGSFPQSLAARDRLRGVLFENLAQSVHSVAAYDPGRDEYHLGLVWGEDNDLITRRWVCSGFKRGSPSWTYDDSPTITALGSVVPPSPYTTIDELSGTVDSLSGTIDRLSSRAVLPPTIYAGVDTGEVIEFGDYSGDWDGSPVEATFQSQNIGSLTNRRTLKDLEVVCSAPHGGAATVEIGREGAWKSKIVTFTVGSQNARVRMPKTSSTGDDLFWRIRTNAPGFKIYRWWARVMDKGPQAGGRQ
jgi:hypothetical protein